jgi:hypothetical protein
VSHVEQKYQDRIEALTPKQRIAHAAGMFQWARETIARQIVAPSGPMSSERLKWLVARRQYGSDPAICAKIDRMLERVPN